MSFQLHIVFDKRNKFIKIPTASDSHCGFWLWALSVCLSIYSYYTTLKKIMPSDENTRSLNKLFMSLNSLKWKVTEKFNGRYSRAPTGMRTPNISITSHDTLKVNARSVLAALRSPLCSRYLQHLDLSGFLSSARDRRGASDKQTSLFFALRSCKTTLNVLKSSPLP